MFFVPWNKDYVVYFIVQSAFLSQIKCENTLIFFSITFLHIFKLLQIKEGVPYILPQFGQYEVHFWRVEKVNLLFFWLLSRSQSVIITLVQQTFFQTFFYYCTLTLVFTLSGFRQSDGDEIVELCNFFSTQSPFFSIIKLAIQAVDKMFLQWEQSMNEYNN